MPASPLQEEPRMVKGRVKKGRARLSVPRRMRLRSGAKLAMPALLGYRVAAAVAHAFGGRYSLRNKVAVVTGGSRGLGLELSRELSRKGARVAICARDADELARARADGLRRGFELSTFVCDLTDRSSVEQLFKNIEARLGHIDVLVNNAGVIQVGPVEEMTVQDWDDAMRIHFWGPLHAIRAVLPQMQRRRSGRIVNISSIGGMVAVPHLLPYDASKFALTGLSEGLRAELAKDRISVTTVCPGLMRTGSPRNALFKGQHRAELAWFALGATPLTSMSSARAARRIVAACRRGEAHVVLTWQAQLLALAHGIAPGAVARALGVVARLLPRPGGIGTQSKRGSESTPAIVPAWLRALDERAARRNNEVRSPGR